MALAKDTQKQISQAVNERAGSLRACTVCGHTSWTIADAVVTLAGQAPLGTINVGPFRPADRLLPSVALVCDNCGKTHLLNLLVLGLGHLLEEENLS